MLSRTEFVLRTLLATAIVGAGTFAAIRLAAADPGGSTRSALTVAGTLTGVPATPAPTLVFVFRKSGSECRTTASRVDYDGARFSAELPLDGNPCRAFFDGADVVTDVEVNGSRVVTGGAVNPVPYARYADQVGTPDCPVGYSRDSDPLVTADMRLCRRRRSDGTAYDEVMRVGSGPSAFWVDRYESSVWEAADGAGRQRFTADADFDPTTFPRDGQWTVALYALSRRDVMPARYVTWFQANAACRTSGKRLLHGDEWLEAGARTSDPGAPSNGDMGLCVTSAAGPRPSGGTACRSRWGVEEMIGNLSEWTADWAASPATEAGLTLVAWSGPEFRSDVTIHVAGSARDGFGGTAPLVPGIPAAVIRGGAFGSGTTAGLFYYAVSEGPASWHVPVGFRCMVAR